MIDRSREGLERKEIMGSEAEKESSYDTPKLPLFSASHGHMQSPERSGMLTPPLHASASVPFRWEEKPGKPKPYNTTLATFISNPNDFVPKCLELPPRLLLPADAKNIAKLPSPTTVLEGPYMGASSSWARIQHSSSSSSFRMASECYGSFRAGSCSPEMVQLGAMAVTKKGYKEKGFMGSWKRRALKARSEVGGNSYVFPSYGDRDSESSRELGEESSSSTSVKITRIRRVGSFPGLSPPKSHFWASIYEGIKQVVPWRNRREKKDGFMG